MAGDTVLHHDVWDGRVWSARPMRVVDDTGDRVALWFPLGTRFKRAIPAPGSPSQTSRGERLAECARLGRWDFEDAEWDVSTLVLMRSGEWHAVWCSWRGGEHLGWYVNLQEPFRRTSMGFETMDLVLDVVISVDGSWHWKDEDELETFVARGVLDDALASRLRTEGLDVVRRARQHESPFDEPWPSWRPDPAWDRPELPRGWERSCR
jgi:uncharacterized protein DUF402